MGEFVCFRLSKGGIFKSIKNVKKNYTLKKKKGGIYQDKSNSSREVPEEVL